MARHGHDLRRQTRILLDGRSDSGGASSSDAAGCRVPGRSLARIVLYRPHSSAFAPLAAERPTPDKVRYRPPVQLIAEDLVRAGRYRLLGLRNWPSA